MSLDSVITTLGLINVWQASQTLIALFSRLMCYQVLQYHTVEPPYNEAPRDWQIVFAIKRFRYIVVLFHIFCYYWGKEDSSLYRGLRYIEVRYIEISLYFLASQWARPWIGSLSKDVFERRTSTGSETFSLFICLDTTKFVLLSFISLIKTIYLRVSNKPQPNAAKSPLPVDVRRSKTLLLKLPNASQLGPSCSKGG